MYFACLVLHIYTSVDLTSIDKIKSENSQEQCSNIDIFHWKISILEHCS